MKPPRASLAALLTAQAQETFNDCAAKMMLGALAQQLARVTGQDPKPILAIIAALLVFPYVAFGPVCGWLSDRFPKRRVLNATLISQIAVMLILVGSLGLKSFWGAMVGFFLLSSQTAVLAPAKRGILLEYVGPQKLSRWVGYMEMFNITAILVGSFAGGAMFSHWLGTGGDPWAAAQNTAWVLTALAVFAWAQFQVAQPTTAQSTEPFRWNLWVRHFRDVTEVWQTRPLWRATMGICFFYGVGGYATVLLQQVGYELTHGGPDAALTSSKMLLMVGVGTMVGNLLAGLLSRRGVELGLAPIGGAMLAMVLIALGFTTPGTLRFTLLLIGTGFSSGFFLVPLYAFIQEKAGNHRRGRILAGVSLLDSLAGMAAAGIYGVVASDRALGWSASTQFFLMAAVTLAMLAYALYHLPHQTLCTVMRLVGRFFYKVKVVGRENIPSGSALILCNHLSYVDAVVLQIASPRPVRFVAFAGFAKSRVLRYLFRAAGVIPVNPGRPLKGIRLAWDALQAGDIVCMFPEGAISRTGQLMELRRGFETIVRQAKVPVVPAAIDGLWGSIYSFAGNRYLWKSPRLTPTPVCIVFGAPIASDRADVASMRKAMLDVGEQAFQERPMLKRHLGREIVRSLARRPGHVELVDRTAERREVKAGQLLAAAATLSRHLRKIAPEPRIGIVLPPGAGAHIANLAIACAGKVPVNLNFTAGKAAVEASLRLGEIRTVITADAMKAKLPNFPFPENTLDLKQAIEAAGGKRAIVTWLLAAWVLPNQWVANMLGLPKDGDRAEAALLFTSGSSGEPKGVVLTHRNIFANCAQISSLSILPDTAVLMACLPVFHSFGFTVTLWYPMLRGCKVITVPSPLDTKKIIEAIEQEKATVMLGAPTFVRPFLKKATKAELASLNLVVTGAEKLTMDLYESFLGQFGIEILQGYGLTETAPATNINQHNPPVTTSTAAEQLGKRTGAVGRLMPGMTARIVDPESGKELPMNKTGMLWLKGANIFPGYLKDPEKTAGALREGGWFVTGDLGRFDDDGFLFIEGRLSRFSKIGGEMVPHGTIETRILELFGWEQNDGPVVAITGVPDPSKGEALVLLTTQDVTLEQIRGKLLESGVPNLWVPKILRKVDKIPMLGSGKTDLKAVGMLALELTKGQGDA
jgi:acyl-[acyl-carrier-protein]-phospholipid O-acyltransferase/long-chain-fatty-acid--[acyl-carrier-protein] ligase